MCFPIFIVFFNPVHQRTDVDFAEYLQILAVRKLLYLLALRYDVQRDSRQGWIACGGGITCHFSKVLKLGSLECEGVARTTLQL